MIGRERDRELMSLAVELSRRSQAEADGRVHPFVGAVIAHTNGTIISTGYRGRYVRGNHGEQEALFGVPPDVVKGALVYSTLEPCVRRGRQTPCSLRLLDMKVAEVVIGILDPNRDIRGRGWWELEESGIRVRNFDADLVKEIREMNKEFIDDQLGPGLMITEVQTESGDPIVVSEEHRAKLRPVEINGTSQSLRVLVKGTYRIRPAPGHRLRLLVRRDVTYWPQSPVDFGFDRDQSCWQAPSAWVRAGQDNELIIAELSEDLEVAIRHYGDVHGKLSERAGNDAWVGIRMDQEPPGFVRRAAILLRPVA